MNLPHILVTCSPSLHLLSCTTGQISALSLTLSLISVHHVFTNSSLWCFIFPSCLYIFGSPRSSICSVGFRLGVCCPLCQRAHAVHAAELCLLQCRPSCQSPELPFPLLLQATSSALSASHLRSLIPVGNKYL